MADTPATIPLMLALVATAAVAVLFASAGLAKLHHRALLPGVIANYRLLPAALVAPAALLLGPAELLVAVALLAGLAPAAHAVAGLLLLLFAGAMGINVARGRRQIDCGCGHSALRQPLGWGQVARNVGLAGVVVLAGAALAAPDAAEQIDAATRLLAAAGGVALYAVARLFASVAALGRSARAGGLVAAHRR